MISIQTVITVVSALSSVGVVVGAILACHKWFLKQEKQDEDIKAMKEEMCLLTYGVLACLKGLKEQGCNGPVTEAVDKIEKHMNQEAHK